RLAVCRNCLINGFKLRTRPRKAIKDFNSNERNILLMHLGESGLHLPEALLAQLGIMDSSITLESKFF
ncbi:hypothetical protein, partial [Legionella pneumophila]